MSLTLKARSGFPLRARIRYWEPGKTDLIDTTGKRIRLQLRSAQRNGRVLMSVAEYTGSSPAPSGTVLTRVTPGEWVLNLGRAVTRSLPPSTRFEFELVDDADPDDVEFLFDGSILVTPQTVTNND